MPWRAPYIRYRRHPLALSVYLVVGTLGVLLFLDVLNSQAVDAIVPDWLRISWQWEMIMGGVSAFAACMAPPSMISGSLRLEGLGSFLCACGMATYSASIIYVTGWDTAGWVLFAILAIGLLSRSVQTIFDARRLMKMAERITHGYLPDQKFIQ